MTGLEALDLSRNRLSCSIPISLTNLSFLSYLNVSYNNLVGKIPLESQLATFDSSSYLGNHNLCGPPLALSCPTNESFEDQHCKHSEEHEGINGEHEGQDDSMNWLETPSFYICMVLGFSTGFWAFWGPLIVSRTWRHSYFGFLDRFSDNIYVTIVIAAARLKRKFLSQ
ncbi:putative LRR receptor-like serine/threonine-protein kinase [Senna tora]|uniref:Putative LRR receptor-like serine/threonine-protein kinase n=1 Tax=Senna tora TaxID=362788 RepID=A0A835CGZ0_9FABA|nr:putative LRR receptor-like serine/threonine-protein kinase [Senna tora]